MKAVGWKDVDWGRYPGIMRDKAAQEQAVLWGHNLDSPPTEPLADWGRQFWFAVFVAGAVARIMAAFDRNAEPLPPEYRP